MTTMTMISPPTSMNSVASLRDALMRLSQAGLTQPGVAQRKLLNGWTRLDDDFITLAHPHQEPPERGNNGAPWTTWFMLGGRGSGKTRLGAEWVRALVHGVAPYAARA